MIYHLLLLGKISVYDLRELVIIMLPIAPVTVGHSATWQ